MLLLLALCIAVAYFVSVVHLLQQKRDKTAESWRQSVVLLDRDYFRIERLWREKVEQNSVKTAQQAADLDPGKQVDHRSDFPTSTSPPDNSLREFCRLADEFRTTVDLAKQRAAADSTEQFLSQGGRHSYLDLSPSPELCDSVEAYNQNLKDERNTLVSFGGRVVRIFLVVPELTDFQLGR